MSFVPAGMFSIYAPLVAEVHSSYLRTSSFLKYFQVGTLGADPVLLLRILIPDAEEPVSRWAPVYPYDTHIPQIKLPEIYGAAVAFVLLSKGGDWGWPHVEAVVMLLPIIYTNWSGPIETSEYKLNKSMILDLFFLPIICVVRYRCLHP
jgi:glycosyltransferase involved in cell wall biosynthesis